MIVPTSAQTKELILQVKISTQQSASLLPPNSTLQCLERHHNKPQKSTRWHSCSTTHVYCLMMSFDARKFTEIAAPAPSSDSVSHDGRFRCRVTESGRTVGHRRYCCNVCDWTVNRKRDRGSRYCCFSTRILCSSPRLLHESPQSIQRNSSQTLPQKKFSTQPDGSEVHLAHHKPLKLHLQTARTSALRTHASFSLVSFLSLRSRLDCAQSCFCILHTCLCFERRVPSCIHIVPAAPFRDTPTVVQCLGRTLRITSTSLRNFIHLRVRLRICFKGRFAIVSIFASGLDKNSVSLKKMKNP